MPENTEAKPKKIPYCNLGIYMPESLRERIKATGKREKRTISNWARIVLEEAVEKAEREVE